MICRKAGRVGRAEAAQNELAVREKPGKHCV